ncbi:MAG: hypothetical protein KatS3mg113_0009 [Planctomycetaceae bacterium]|nr:MAG: hypothetical protein KatS3mg113_0009 [Planctomycetaceae bacterium]
MDPEFVVTALSVQMPGILRWAGGIAREMRRHNISLVGKKNSGSAATDALTLADLTIQELLVAALRDTDPIFRCCRIEAEETTGDIQRFSTHSPLVIALDPIDGTKQYRDRTGNGYAILLHLRNADQVLYSLSYLPEKGPHGWWVEAYEDHLAVGPDDPQRPALDVLRSLPTINPQQRLLGRQIYLIGFQHREHEAARRVTATGLVGVPSDEMSGSLYDLLASGEFAGALIHTPNVYDFPIALQIARLLGGDAVWVHNGQSVHFRETWRDERAAMTRLPGIVACAADPDILTTLVEVACSWNPERYRSGDEL